MTLTAKSIIKNTFWIVERDGEKIATIQSSPAGVVYVQGQERETFPSIKVLGAKHNITFDSTKPTKVKQDKSEQHMVYDYPTASKPFNILLDVAKKLPVFTKTSKSRSYYCAGYYIIQFNNGWVQSFNPKLITLNRYEFKGPFKTKMEMQEQLRINNGK